MTPIHMKSTHRTAPRRRGLRGLLASIALAVILPCDAAIIDGFPAHGTELSPVQNETLSWYAGQIVDDANAGGGVQVLIVGHADFDPQGSDFEMQISAERAATAESALRSLVAESAARRHIPSDRIAGISYRKEALGTREPIYEHPANERQRQANRRVEIAWLSAPPSPHPGPLPAPPSSTEFEIRVVGGASISASLMLLGGPQADNYVFQIVDLTKRQTAFFLYTGAGVGIAIPKIPGPGSVTFAGPPVRFTTTRHVELYQFNSKASLFQEPGASLGTASIWGKLGLAIDEIVDAESRMAFTRPGILTMEGGPGFAMPGGGSVTKGVLALNSAVFPFTGY